MKNLRWLLSIFVILHFGYYANAQVTNLKVNDVSSNFSMVSGGTLKWEYNLPVGGTAICEIWIDINSNGVIDLSTDKQLFGTFTQTDGDYNGGNGPGDMDSVVNGRCYFEMANFGFAPANYVLRFTYNDVGQSITGIVTAIPTPAYTVSGHVTPPPGINAQNILISTGGDGPGWMALTDASGNYTIKFNSSAAGLQCNIQVVDIFPPYIFTPAKVSFTLTESHTGIDFTYQQPAAKVVGYLKGEDGHIFANNRVSSDPNSGGNSKKVTTDINGFFQFGFTSDEISSSPLWRLYASSEGIAPAYFPPQSPSISLHDRDSQRVDLTAYLANDSITGKVTVDGHAPDNYSFHLNLGTSDSGYTSTTSDPTTGNFTFHVTKKIFNYYIGIDNSSIPNGYGTDYFSMAHPGDKNFIIRIVRIGWLAQMSNTNNSLRAISFVNPAIGWVAGDNGTVLASVDSGKIWVPEVTNTTNNINGISFANALTGWFVGNGGIIKKTITGGVTWTSQNSTTTNDLYSVQFINTTTGWASGGGLSGGIVLRTTNGGTNWSSVTPGTGNLNSLSFVDASTGWAVGNNGTIIKTTDGGSNWSAQSSLTYSNLYSVHFINASIGWASGSSGIIIKTTDGGSNWTPQSYLGCDLHSIFFINNTTGWAAGDCNAIMGTTDGGSNWVKQINNGNANYNAILFYDANNGWVVGDNGTILRTTIGGKVPAAVESRPNRLPYAFNLSQNYPNPFNPSTTISFDLQSRSFVSLKIFNLLGKEVATIVSGVLPAGHYDKQWNAADMSSGVYFYRIQAGSFIQTKKLVLLR